MFHIVHIIYWIRFLLMFVIIGKGVGLKGSVLLLVLTILNFFGAVWVFFSNPRGYSSRSKPLYFGGLAVYVNYLVCYFLFFKVLVLNMFSSLQFSFFGSV